MDIYGKGQSPRKTMAMDGGSFGVGKMPSSGQGMHPDAMSGLGEKGAMADGDRGVGMPVHHSKDMHPSQAAPRHGAHMPNGPDGKWSYGGKA